MTNPTSTPTPAEARLRSMLIELAESTPVRIAAPVLPAEVSSETGDRAQAVAVPEAHDGADAPVPGDEVAAARKRRLGGSRLAWALTAVAGVLVAVMVVGLLRVGDAADPFAKDPSDVPSVDLGALAGGRLAFVMDNDLFVADASSGVTRRITDVGRGNEVSKVSWSHDGQWVAFTVHDEDGIWVVRRDGSERHRLPGRPSTYTWSPTNDELVYALDDEVRLGQVDGTWRALEGNFPPAPYTNVVWSPDGSRVAFAGQAGNLAIGTLQGRPDAGWNSGVQPPVRGVVAWPRDDHLIVQERSAGTLLSFDPGTGQSTPLAEVDHTFTAADDVGIDPTGRRMVILTDAETWLCPLDQGADAPCVARGEPGIGLSSPRFVPGTDDLSVIFTAEADGAADPGDSTETTVLPESSGIAPGGSALLLSFSLASDRSDGSRLVEGLLDHAHRGTINVGRVGYGVEPEAQIPIDGGFLVRVDEGRIESVSGTRQDAPRLVVDGDRFLSPSDDYPGGSGLAYWHP